MLNQQAWMFRWILSVVFPRLLPSHILSKMKIIISDGDPQEYFQINNAIQNHYPQAKRVRCGWHLIAKGFEKHVDSKFPNLPENFVQKNFKLLMNWCYSWMKNDCETY